MQLSYLRPQGALLPQLGLDALRGLPVASALQSKWSGPAAVKVLLNGLPVQLSWAEPKLGLDALRGLPLARALHKVGRASCSQGGASWSARPAELG